jgi:hypothetical protein
VVRVTLLVAPILVSLGFFPSVLSPKAERPNGLINLIYLAAVLLAAGLVATRANGHPALAAYLPGVDGSHHAYGLMVLVVAGDGIQAVTGFQDASLFPAFGLPTVRQDPEGPTCPRLAGRRVSAAR